MEASQPHEPGLRPVRLLEDTQQKFIRVHLHWGQASHAVFSEHAQSAHQASQDRIGRGREGKCAPPPRDCHSCPWRAVHTALRASLSSTASGWGTEGPSTLGGKPGSGMHPVPAEVKLQLLFQAP